MHKSTQQRSLSNNARVSKEWPTFSFVGPSCPPFQKAVFLHQCARSAADDLVTDEHSWGISPLGLVSFAFFSWADGEIKTSWCIPQSKKPVDAVAGSNYQHHTRVPSISTSSADQSGPKTNLICLKFWLHLLCSKTFHFFCNHSRGRCSEAFPVVEKIGIDSQYFARLRLFQCGMCDFVLE